MIEKEEEKRGFQNNGFNQFRSDRIPLDREVPDTRDPRCVFEGERKGEREMKGLEGGERDRERETYSPAGVSIGDTPLIFQQRLW